MIKWSFSGLKQYANCPKQYHEVKVLRAFVQKETSQMRYGTEVHKALEEYVANNTPLPKFYERFKSHVDTLKSIDGTKLVEHKMGLDVNKQACSFDSPDYWVRGIADLLIIDNDLAWVVDYKTGSSRYPDVKQLKLMALMVFEHFKSVKTVRAALLFLLDGALINEEYAKGDAAKLWESFEGDLTNLQMSHEREIWPAKTSPLCRFCPVTTCDFHRG